MFLILSRTFSVVEYPCTQRVSAADLGFWRFFCWQQVMLSENSGSDEEDEEDPCYEMLVISSGAQREWTIRRSYGSLYRMDRQLHKCIFDRNVSRLPEMRENLVNEIGAVVWSPSCGISVQLIVITTFMVQVEKLIRGVCFRTLTFELNELWPRYLAYWFTLTVSRSGSEVKVIDEGSWSQEECC